MSTEEQQRARETLLGDLSVGMTAVRETLEQSGMGDWEEYLVVRRPGKEENYVILSHPEDQSDFPDRLRDLHREQCAREK